MSDALAIGWYGKLPCSGDFVSRRVSRPLLDLLDDWLRRGLAEMRAATPDRWREWFAVAPAWNFAVPAGCTGGTTLIGVIAPSSDRVGREFPLWAGVALSPDASAGNLLAHTDGWLMALGRALIAARDRPQSIDIFDASLLAIAVPDPDPNALPADAQGDILAILGPASSDVSTLPMPLAYALPWPELPTLFDARTATSYWWTNTAAGGPLRGFTTDAGLSPSLLATLMQPLANHARSAP